MQYYDDTDNHLLELECTNEGLSESQLAAYKKADEECLNVRNKLNEIVKENGGEALFTGDMFSAYHFMGPTPLSLEEISKPLSEYQKEWKQNKSAKSSKKEESPSSTRAKREYKSVDIIDEDNAPLSKRIKPKEPPKKSVIASGKNFTTNVRSKTGEKAQVLSNIRPSESTAIGGLIIGSDNKSSNKEIVDLTKDNARVTADSKEISFNKLQGKTFPSLVVVARPSLQVKENAAGDRVQLDAKVKAVLMNTPTKFTEWLIQQGLVRSEQMCQIHSASSLKLGMYSDSSKFPFSGGYVWISECCPTRFISVFNGSIFECASHPPSVILKLMYHWACHTNVQNVVQWVKIDNLYIKSLYTSLRSICTVALHQHMALLGGSGKKIEVGVISLGTTTQDGQQRQVKVEVLGVLDPENKLVRLRAVEPLADSERNYKKRFAKILEPLPEWVNKDSIILTDLTVDKGTLNGMGYRSVIQATPSDINNRNSNANIMDYLRRIVPRMFQNTLSLLSRQIIQQFLDELVWREIYGTSSGAAFDNIIIHLAEQTRLHTKEPLASRLNKVAGNPFKDWSHLSVPLETTKRTKGKREASVTETVTSATILTSPVIEYKKTTVKGPQKKTTATTAISTKTVASKTVAPKVVKKTAAPKEEIIAESTILENYYYGVFESEVMKLNALDVDFNVTCLECPNVSTKNTDLQDHIYNHIFKSKDSAETIYRCRYCTVCKSSQRTLEKHIIQNHSVLTKTPHTTTLNCLICDLKFNTPSLLFAHMKQKHTYCELPYSCPSCEYRCSSHHLTIDHFYEKHSKAGSLLCPFCLKVYNVFQNDKANRENVQAYMLHLKQHKSSNKKCSRCSLSFLQEGHRKVHSKYFHKSFPKKVEQMTTASTSMIKPKAKAVYQKDLPFKIVRNIDSLSIDCPNGFMCLECDADLEDEYHIWSLMKCNKCNYQTYCLPSMMDHGSTCPILYVNQMQLETELHCVCGFSSNIGNMIARHLSLCEMSTAYTSPEIALENTVKKSMLDMLGLVRRDDENEPMEVEGNNEKQDTLNTTDENMETESVQQADNEKVGTDEIEIQQAENQDNDNQQSDNQQSQYSYQSNEPSEFNTQLSLDDLGPPSILQSSSDNDRTPQLKGEYQSLATPRVLHDQEVNEFNPITENIL